MTTMFTRRASKLTVNDQFCGAGGSTLDAIAAGADVRIAMNHWPRACTTYNHNNPNTQVICADVSSADPRRIPRTDVLITSPECTNHSSAKTGKREPDLFDPVGDVAADRSRATMWDVPRFAEHHRYDMVIVENVVEARKWPPFASWLEAMVSWGYCYKIVYLNSMVAWPTPQSRDRMYVVFWRKGNPAPDLDIRPAAWCWGCERQVAAYQAWKNADRPFGKYRTQYLYRCPTCRGVCAPIVYPAASAIDWSLPIQRIGDRPRPLAPATLRRVQVGIERFWSPMVAQVGGHGFERGEYVRAWPLDRPLPAMTTSLTHGLAIPPVMVPTEFGGDHAATKRPSPVDGPMPTQTARNTLGVAVPPAFFLKNYGPAFVVKNYGDGTDPSMAKSIDETLGAITTQDHHALAMLPFLTHYYGQGGASSVGQPAPTLTTRDRIGLVDAGETIAVDDCGFRMFAPHEVGAGMAFPPPDEYVVTGNKRERVRQYGNAVTPPVMTELFARCAASLEG